MPIVHIRLVLQMGLRRLHKWHCWQCQLCIPWYYGWGYADCVSGLVWQCQLTLWICMVKIEGSDFFGQIEASDWLRGRNPAFSLVEIHSWHSSKAGTFIYFWCIIGIVFYQTMPIVHAMPFMWARQCQICRQCQLVQQTMPNMHAMPFSLLDNANYANNANYATRQCQMCTQCHLCISDNAKYADNANCAHNAIFDSHAMPIMHTMPIVQHIWHWFWRTIGIRQV